MCEMAIVRRADGAILWCETMGELADALRMPVRLVPVGDGYAAGVQDRRVCLCPVDFRRLAEWRGMKCRKLPWNRKHSGEWELRPPSPLMCGVG